MGNEFVWWKVAFVNWYWCNHPRGSGNKLTLVTSVMGEGGREGGGEICDNRTVYCTWNVLWIKWIIKHLHMLILLYQMYQYNTAQMWRLSRCMCQVGRWIYVMVKVEWLPRLPYTLIALIRRATEGTHDDSCVLCTSAHTYYFCFFSRSFTLIIYFSCTLLYMYAHFPNPEKVHVVNSENKYCLQTNTIVDHSAMRQTICQ